MEIWLKAMMRGWISGARGVGGLGCLNPLICTGFEGEEEGYV
jgi:hypothetical protein